MACQVDLGPVTEISTDASLASGLIVDGPVVKATITVTDAIGNIVAATVGLDDASFNVSVPQGTLYPITIEASGGRDVVTQSEPLFPMTSVKLSPDERSSNINPFSTLMVKMAQAMPGGVTGNNLETARRTVFEKFAFGLDSILVPNPASSEISGANVAAIIKASESLTETIRRARDALLVTGSTIEPEAVLDAVAADMAADGVLDGRGVDADPRIAATVTVASAQVLIEALSNSLTINGVDVTTAMDAGIQLTSLPFFGTTADVVITEPMLKQARVAITAAQALSASAEISDVMNALNGLNGGSNASDIQAVLPPENARVFDDVITQVVLGTGTQLEGINESVRLALVSDTSAPPDTVPSGSTDGSTTGTGSTDGGTSGSSTTDGGSTGSGTVDGGATTDGSVNDGTTGGDTTGGGSSVDVQAPVITVLGSDPVTIETGNAYVEAGATALDNMDGDVSANIVISSLVNTGAAGSYTVTYSVNDSSGNAATATRRVEVVDPVLVPGSFGLGSAAYTVNEGDGSVDIEILRVGGSDGDVTLDWRTRTFNGYGTADWSSDYATVDLQPLTFADGETSKIVSVTIHQDTTVEDDETFSVLVQNPTGGASLGAATSAVVTIVDDDVAVADPGTTGNVYPPDTTLTTLAVPVVSRPAYLVTITEPAFGTKVTRVTDNAVFGQSNVRHYYSKVSAWNSDGSLINMNRTLLDGMTYAKLGTFSSSGEMRWSHVNPSKMFNAAGNRFTTTDVITNQTTTLHTFSQYESCFLGPWEGNISADDRYVALACKQGSDLVAVVYDIANDVVETARIFAGMWGDANFDWLSISQSGQYVVINWRGSEGVVAYDRNMNVVSRLASSGAHGDLGYDTAGDEVYVQFFGTGMFTAYRLRDGYSYAVLDRSHSFDSGHISCRNVQRPGWCYFSVFNTGDLFAIKLDGSQTVERFAHHRSSVGSYDAQPQAVPSMDGAKVMFASDWGGSEINSYVVEMQ
jgi:hypothetical protein